MLIMNMWYKIVENRQHNFEILAKFLIHNLSSFIMKLRSNSEQTARTTPNFATNKSTYVNRRKTKHDKNFIFNLEATKNFT